MDWFRWHSGTVTDPKFRYISSRTCQPVANVLAIWACVLERAADHYGDCSGVDFDSLDIHLGIEEGATILIYRCMQAKGMITEDNRVANWSKRQPKYEDPTAAERKRAQREREKAEQSQQVTECHGMSRNVTTEEKRIEDLKTLPDAVAPADPVKPKKPRAAKPADPRHGWFVSWYCWAFANITGDSYAFSAADAGILARLLKCPGFDQLLERACYHLLLPDEQRFPRGSPDLKSLAANVNKYAGQFTVDTEASAIRCGLLPQPGVNLKHYRPWEQK